MIYTVDTSKHVTRWQPPARTRPWKRYMVHTTEGRSTSGDLNTLIGNDAKHQVSIHDYLARPANGKIVLYEIVPFTHVAYHTGYMLINGEWTAGGNGDTAGLEIGHKEKEPWDPYHLAASLEVVRSRVGMLGNVELCRHQDYAKGRPASLGGVRSDPTDFLFWEPFKQLAFLPAYPLLGPPDIALDIYERRLTPFIGSDAARAAYATVVRYGLRPGPMLALIGQESEFGKTDAGRNNWGNRRKAFRPERQIGTEAHGIALYRSMVESCEDACESIVSGPAYLKKGVTDVVTWRCVWAPYGDGPNNPFADSVRMLSWISEWRKQPVAKNYEELWGSVGDAPFVPGHGIPDWFARECDAGRYPGRCLSPERRLATGEIRQDFEDAVAIYHDGTGVIGVRVP